MGSYRQWQISRSDCEISSNCGKNALNQRRLELCDFSINYILHFSKCQTNMVNYASINVLFETDLVGHIKQKFKNNCLQLSFISDVLPYQI